MSKEHVRLVAVITPRVIGAAERVAHKVAAVAVVDIPVRNLVIWPVWFGTDTKDAAYLHRRLAIAPSAGGNR
jgi:hypothetical protein